MLAYHSFTANIQGADVQVLGQEPVTGHARSATEVTANSTVARDRLCQAVARLDQAEAQGRPAELIDALLHVAHCYLTMHTYSAAEDFLRQALRAARRFGSPQQLVAILTELAQTAGLRAQDLTEQDPSVARVSRDRARDCAFEASILIHKQQQASWAGQALLAVSEVLMLCGDHDDAAAMRLRAASWQSAH